jgi:hypothetical protein
MEFDLQSAITKFGIKLTKVIYCTQLIPAESGFINKSHERCYLRLALYFLPIFQALATCSQRRQQEKQVWRMRE